VFIAGAEVSESTFIGTGPDGTGTEVRGRELFEFVGDKIRREDAFRKVRAAPRSGEAEI
jgi:hypothetical protein